MTLWLMVVGTLCVWVCVPVFPCLWDPPHLDALEWSLSAYSDIDIGVAV